MQLEETERRGGYSLQSRVLRRVCAHRSVELGDTRLYPSESTNIACFLVTKALPELRFDRLFSFATPGAGAMRPQMASTAK